MASKRQPKSITLPRHPDGTIHCQLPLRTYDAATRKCAWVGVTFRFSVEDEAGMARLVERLRGAIVEAGGKELA